MKTCEKCSVSKALDQFYPDKRGKQGTSPICRDCAGYTKVCGKCKVEKPLAQFDNEPRNCSLKGKGVVSKCKECSRAFEAVWKATNQEHVRAYQANYYQNNRIEFREASLKAKYGITQADFDTLLKSQDGRCAIYGTTEPKGNGDFHVDHCHQTGKVRGLLCHGCNTGLGNLQESVDVVQRALVYLLKHS